MIIFTDIHGCVNTMKALLDKIPQEEQDKGICIAGDIIDRGKHSKDVVQFIIDNGYDCVLGNHEEFMIDGFDDAIAFMKKTNLCPMRSLWETQGGYETLMSYNFDYDLLNKHYEWICKLPLYLEYKDVKNKEGRHLVVSHSNILNVWERRNDPNHFEYFRQHTLWTRNFHNLKDPGDIFNIHGHTPVGSEHIRKIYANIDTGCAYGKQVSVNPRTGKVSEDYGKLTALQYPEMIIYQQDKLEEDN